MTCIIIASWMLAVVGAAIMISSSYYIKQHYNDSAYVVTTVTFLCMIISIIALVFGLVMFIISIAPYIPPIPCITIIP